MLTIVITGLVLMRAWRLSEVLSSSINVWKEWELRGAVFLSLALQMVLICLGNRRKYLRHTWVGVVTWSAYLLADSVAIYTIGMISCMIREIKAGESLSKMDAHTELSTFWAPFLLLHLGGPDAISGYSIEDNELWLRHLMTLVNQTSLTVYILVTAWTHPTLSFLAILILLSGVYKYGERVWVLRAASCEGLQYSVVSSRRGYSDKIVKECELKQAEGYNVVPHHVIDVDNDYTNMIDVAIAEFPCKKLSSRKESEDQYYKCIAGTLLSASHLVNTSQRLFANHLFSMEECDTCLSILRGKHCAGDFKVIEIELGLIYDMFYSKAKAVYTRWGLICRLAILFSICVALVLFSFTDEQPYSKPDLFLTFLLLGVAIFIELYALAHVLFSDQAACWLIEKKQSAVFYFINWLRPMLKRSRWSNSMGQYNLMSFEKNDSRWWRFLTRLHVDEMAVKFLYQGNKDVGDDIKDLITLKIREMEARDVQKLQARELQKLQARELQKLQARELQKLQVQDFQLRDRGIHALRKHMLLDGELKKSIELDFDVSILVWHIATELCYFLDYGWQDSTKELERNNQRLVKKKCLMGLYLSRYMLYLQYMCPSMLPARFGSIKFQDIYKEPSKHFDLPKFAQEESEIAEAKKKLSDKMSALALERVSEEDQIKFVLNKGCHVAMDLGRYPRRWKWEAISEVWVEMLMYGANKCKARDHAQQMRGGGELITHVWLLMSQYGLTDSFRKEIGLLPATTAEIIMNPW